MPRPLNTFCAVMALVLVMGLTTVVRADVFVRPDDEYPQLDLNDTLRNLIELPRDRCKPKSKDVAAVRSSSSSAKCNLLYSSVPFGGQCHGLLQQGPCSVNHWVVLDKTTDRATCQFQECPDHNVLVAGGCTRLGKAASNHHCPPTLQLIINEYGEAECECPLLRIFHSPSGKCYDPYEQGPCKDGNILQLVEKDGNVFSDCVPSLCSTPGQVPMTPKCELAQSSETTPGDGSYKCYSLHTMGPCSTGFLVLDRRMLDVVCTPNNPYGLFDFLNGGMPCLPGSLRDNNRECRRMFESIPDAVLKAVPTVEPGVFEDGNVCPNDYVFLGEKCWHTQSGH